MITPLDRDGVYPDTPQADGACDLYVDWENGTWVIWCADHDDRFVERHDGDTDPSWLERQYNTYVCPPESYVIQEGP